MKRWLRGFLVLFYAASAAAACPPMTAFIAKLSAGERVAELPDFKSCDNDFTPELAKALATYVQSHSRADVEPLVATIKDGYRKAEWKTAFADLAIAVQTELASTGFKPPETEDKYALLDTLPQRAKPDAATPPPPPKPVVQKRTPPPQVQPPPKPALSPAFAVVALAIVCGIALAGSAAIVLVGRRRALTQQEQIELRLLNLAADVAELKTTLAAFETKFARMESAQQAAVDALRPALLSPQHLDGIAAELRDLRVQIASPVPAVPADNVALEREALGESWKKFRQNEELSAWLDNAAKDESWKEIGDPLLTHLPKLVPDDLKATFDAVLAPAREYNNLVARISVIPKIVSGEVPRLENNAQELARTREFAQLLAMSNNTAFIADRLNFRPRNWVLDHFLTFADLYLQRYQQARMARCDAGLEEGVSIVKRILGVAAVEPIDVKLGETPFDSARHIGRSTTNDARFSDGVIVGVVRNGFIEAGKDVIRQPEVVVNRTR